VNRPKHTVLASPDGITVECGGQIVVIDKLFGPLIACNVRVSLDGKSGEWVVERETCVSDKDEDTGVDGINAVHGWEEVTRFDCQESVFRRRT
jgi:hypothetical protein